MVAVASAISMTTKKKKANILRKRERQKGTGMRKKHENIERGVIGITKGEVTEE